MLIDTHCHLDFPEFDTDRDAVINRALSEGVGYFVNIGSSLSGSEKSLELARRYAAVYAAVGIHPHEADTAGPGAAEAIRKLAGAKKVVAIGEIGLDYYKGFSRPENQRPLFEALLGVAGALDLPVVIHSRQADADILAILQKAQPKKAVVHCFSGDEAFLDACLASGWYVSFTCNVTYPKAERLRAVVRRCPLERIFLETDAPFLSPEGFRGKRNEPAQVRTLAAEIARIKEISIEAVAAATTDNAMRFFDLK